MVYVRSPRNRRARARSFGWMVTRFAWMAAEFVSSKSETRYASDASCRAITADDWKRKSVCWIRLGLQTKQLSKLANSYFEILRNFTNKTLEGQLANEEFSWFLVATDFTQGNSSRAETMRLLHTTGSGCLSIQESRQRTVYTERLVGWLC